MAGKEAIDLDLSFAILGGDARQRHLAQLLRASGFAVITAGVPGEPDFPGGYPTAARAAQVLVLPMPASGAPDALHHALHCAAPGARIFGGMLPAQDAPAHVRLHDFAKNEAFLLANAELTAEAAVSLLLGRMEKPLAGSEILLCGFGRIGRLLARKLAALGAHVTVAARSREAHALCHILGYPSENTAHLPALSRFDAVVNTVPACILPDAAGARPDCMLLELASSPGGFGEAARAHPGYVPARGLPGIYAPRAAAACIRDMILQTLSPEERL